MKQVIAALALALSLAGYSVPAKALQKDGHEQKTKEAAQKLGFSPAAIAILMRGAAMPDFDNYDSAAAHAQTANDEKGKPTETKEQAEANSVQYLRDKSGKFREQLQAGHIEAALYVLGYSIHTIQDFAAHQGMSNAEHALLSYAQINNPDNDPENIEKAEKWTEDFLSQVHTICDTKTWNQLVTYQPPPDDQWTINQSGPTSVRTPQVPKVETAYEKEATSPNRPDVDANIRQLGGYYWDYYYGSYNGEWRPEYRIRWAEREAEKESVKNSLIQAFTDGLCSTPAPTNLEAIVH